MKVKYIQHTGSDLAVVNAARVSFNKESEWEMQETSTKTMFKEGLSAKDTKLIKYLASHGHTSPFNHSFITLHVKAPIFVARQLVKHKFLPWNEVSRRYVNDTPEFYNFPKYRMKAENVKQGSSDVTLIPKGQKGRCPTCEEMFEAKSNRVSYCSPQCQAKGWRSTPEGWVSNKWSRLKQSAKNRGLEFSIEKEDIPTPKHCCYLKVELSYNNSTIEDNSASVDRIDNTKGYIKGNIQVISNLANRMKGIASDEQLILFAKNSLLLHGNFMVPQVDSLELFHEEMKKLYRHLIDNEKMCPEQARGFMPQTLMTEWYWSGTLGAWADMYKLRAKPDAQEETRIIAEQAGEIIAPLFPVSWKELTNE